MGIKNVSVSSAGITAKKEPIHPEVIIDLQKLGISCKKHTQRKLTKEILAKNDLVIAMAYIHKKFIKEKFGITVPLFNAIAIGKNTSIYDIEDIVRNYAIDKKAVNTYIGKTITYIYTKTPALYKKIEKLM